MHSIKQLNTHIVTSYKLKKGICAYMYACILALRVKLRRRRKICFMYFFYRLISIYVCICVCMYAYTYRNITQLLTHSVTYFKL